MSEARMSVVCRAYLAELKKLRERVPCVTAGQLALAMHCSRQTAKKYLKELVRQGRASEYDFIHVNGQTCTAYIPNWGK